MALSGCHTSDSLKDVRVENTVREPGSQCVCVSVGECVCASGVGVCLSRQA